MHFAALLLLLRAAVTLSVLFFFSFLTACLRILVSLLSPSTFFSSSFLLSTGEYGFRLKKKIHVITEDLEDSRALVTSTFSVTRDSVQYILQKINYLVAEDGEKIVEFDQLEDGQKYRAVSYSDAPERRFKVIDEQLEIDASRQLHKHVLQQYPEAHIHHNVKVYQRGNERAQFDAVVHVDGAGGSFAFVMEAKTHVHPTDLAVALDKAAIFRGLLGQDLSFTEGFDPKQPNTRPFSHFASSEVIPCLAGGHFTPELVELCLGDGVNAIYPSGDGFDVALVQK